MKPLRKQPIHSRALGLGLALGILLPLSAALFGQDDSPKRDAWQRPAEVMDALGVQAGGVVADIGSGRGYFTFHLARRVGAGGRVYAVDIDEDVLAAVRRRSAKEGWSQVETILGATDDPRLPPDSLDAALIVNAYHEMRDYDAMLEKIHRALKPGGRLGVIDAATAPGEQRSAYYRRHRIPEELVREDAARHNLRFLREEAGFTRPRDTRAFYFVIFQKPER